MSSAFRKSAHKLKKIARNRVPATSWNVHAGDRVVVTAGRDKGQTGVVERVDRAMNRVVVGGVNIVKRHVRGRDGRPGEIVGVEAPVHYSNVMLADPTSGAAVRAARMFLDDGTKVRVSRGAGASGSVIPMPFGGGGKPRAPRAGGVGPADARTGDARRDTRAESARGLMEVLGGGKGGGGGGGARDARCV